MGQSIITAEAVPGGNFDTLSSKYRLQPSPERRSLAVLCKNLEGKVIAADEQRHHGRTRGGLSLGVTHIVRVAHTCTYTFETVAASSRTWGDTGTAYRPGSASTDYPVCSAWQSAVSYEEPFPPNLESCGQFPADKMVPVCQAVSTCDPVCAVQSKRLTHAPNGTRVGVYRCGFDGPPQSASSDDQQ